MPSEPKYSSVDFMMGAAPVKPNLHLLRPSLSFTCTVQSDEEGSQQRKALSSPSGPQQRRPWQGLGAPVPPAPCPPRATRAHFPPDVAYAVLVCETYGEVGEGKRAGGVRAEQSFAKLKLAWLSTILSAMP